jgi:hypothetical protein
MIVSGWISGSAGKGVILTMIPASPFLPASLPTFSGTNDCAQKVLRYSKLRLRHALQLHGSGGSGGARGGTRVSGDGSPRRERSAARCWRRICAAGREPASCAPNAGRHHASGRLVRCICAEHQLRATRRGFVCFLLDRFCLGKGRCTCPFLPRGPWHPRNKRRTGQYRDASGAMLMCKRGSQSRDASDAVLMLTRCSHRMGHACGPRKERGSIRSERGRVPRDHYGQSRDASGAVLPSS